MIIRVEPKEFFMSTVYLIFNKAQTEPEDTEVKHYLEERQLKPRREFETPYQEQDCLVWQFGGCYLGQHLEKIADIQRRYIEAEVLASEIPRLVQDGADTEVRQAMENLSPAGLQDLMGALVKEFHQDSSFGSDQEGHMQVTLEPAVVQQRFKALLAEQR